MKLCLECLLIVIVVGLIGIAMGWAMDEQITNHTDHVLRIVEKVEGPLHGKDR